MRTFFIALFIIFPILGFAQEEPFIYEDHGRRDPLLPLINANGSIQIFENEFLISDLVLEGIMAGNQGGSLAIINGRILQEEDAIGKYLVQRIGKDYVVLVKDQEEFVLKLKKEE